MVYKRYEINSLVGQEIRVGCVGEHQVRCVEFDVTSWLETYEEGFFVVFVSPPASSCSPSSKQGYLAKTTYDDGVISWVITSNDTKQEGSGSVEVIMYGPSNAVLQSTTVSIRVLPSASHGSGGCSCGSNSNQPWVDQMAHAAIDAKEAAQRAEAALESMEQLAASGVLPPGGEAGQVLTKVSDEDGDVAWRAAPAAQFNIINGGDSYE